ncbi:MAG: hypothetical protein GF329_20495 [Candidatus Lokiarchaeota archaeon]|nr:hypothetical protein [Candidatus Lokiarchaeota archaeon]
MVLDFLGFLRKIFPWFIRYYNRLELHGVHNLPKEGSAIIAANHSGGLDYDNFCLMSALEHFKTKKKNRKRIWLCYHDIWASEDNIWGRFVRKFSPIPINLDGKGIPYDLVDVIVSKGELIAIMPEGCSASIKEGYLLWKFYPGVVKLHLRYKIPIIPTAMIGFSQVAPRYPSDYNPKKVPPWENERIFPFIIPKKLIIHFGEPISFENYYNRNMDKKTMNQLAQIIREKVKETINI